MSIGGYRRAQFWRISIALGGSFLAVFLAVGCGDDGGDAPGGTPGATGAAAEPTVNPWVVLEGDPAPGLPGEFVDIQTIYDGSYGVHGDNATAPHVQRDVDYIGDGNSNPPAGGPHWSSNACGKSASESPVFCGPVPWGIYSDPNDVWEPETLVHNMEHGGVVVWYNTEDEDIIDALQDVVSDIQGLLVLTPYPDMEKEHIALTSWVRIDKFPVAEYSAERVTEFIDAHMQRFNPEGF